MADKLGTPTAVANAANAYFLVEAFRKDVHSMQLVWHDGTTAGTFTVYSSNRENPPIPGSAATPNLQYWSLESEPTPTNPAGSAAGSYMQHLSASGARHYLVRFLASATSSVSVYPHGKE